MLDPSLIPDKDEEVEQILADAFETDFDDEEIEEVCTLHRL